MSKNVKEEIIKIIRSCIEDVIENNDISVRKSIEEDDDNKKNIYNEFSLQHELGIVLRKKLPDGYLVQFERNIISFNNLPVEYKTNDDKIDKVKINKAKIKKDFKKSEIDIVIVNKKDNEEKYAIELKYHRKKLGEVPDFIYNCVVDMWFIKRMVEKGLISKGYCVVVTEDKDIYEPKRKITDNLRNNYIHFKDEDKTKVVKSVEKESGTLNKGNDKWNDEYNVVKKKPNSTDEYYYINTREFYTEENSKNEKHTKLINWIEIEKENKNEAKYYIKEFDEREDKRPTLEDFKESKSVVQYADITTFKQGQEVSL